MNVYFVGHYYLFEYPIAFGNPATVPRMSAARQPTCLSHFQCSNVLLKKCIPERTPMSRNIAICWNICTRNRRQIRLDGTQMSNKSWFGGVFGPCGEGLGAQRAQRPAQMHFRMRKPCSWLTLWGWFFVQFVLFFIFVVVFSTMHPERHFIVCCTISKTFSKTFGEAFGEGWK